MNADSGLTRRKEGGERGTDPNDKNAREINSELPSSVFFAIVASVALVLPLVPRALSEENPITLMWGKEKLNAASGI